MKAVILERRGKYAAVLCDDGTIQKTTLPGEVGETVELDPKVLTLPQKRTKRIIRSAVAAAIALAITSGTLGYMGASASAYVSLDVADSAVELTINHFGRVIAVEAVSDDAAQLAEKLAPELKNMNAADALDHTVAQLQSGGYLENEDDTVIVGVVSGSKQQTEELTGAVERSIGSGHPIFIAEASRAERDEARKQHVSIGKFGYVRDHGQPPEFAPAPPEVTMPEDAPQAAPETPSEPAQTTAPNVPMETQSPPAEPQAETNDPPENAPEQPDSEQAPPDLPQGGEAPEPPQGGESYEPPQGGEAPQPPDGQTPPMMNPQ
ncbi:MAG: hypothetical protein IJS31_02810 [Oscillospiraceae bacterium]|nr:hypothetical protein [Oscillospiraceae bacterium]